MVSQTHDIRSQEQSNYIAPKKIQVWGSPGASWYSSEMMTQDRLSWLQVVRDFPVHIEAVYKNQTKTGESTDNTGIATIGLEDQKGPENLSNDLLTQISKEHHIYYAMVPNLKQLISRLKDM